MRADKHLALKLRLRGKSYSEIQKTLGTPKSTLSAWLSNVTLSENAAQRINNRALARSRIGLLRRNKNQKKLAIERKLARISEASKEINNLTKKELLILGTALYWAEGYKRVIIRKGQERTCHPVSLTNSDPYLVKCFMKFLREICATPEAKIKADIRIYNHLNENKLLEFWSKTTGIPRERFGKTYYGVSKSSQGKKPFNILPFGTIQIRVNSTELFHRIMGWIEGVKQIAST